jgi:hypothetical protein
VINKAYFSFTELTDKTRHPEYNAWHQLDHRPENLALPGVMWGERWVLTPDCCAAGTVRRAPFEAVSYVNMYWFRDPVDESFRDFLRLGDRSFQWGRGPVVPYVRRPFTGSFTPIKGYVTPRVKVSADVLMIRPNTGVEVTVTRLPEPASPATQDLFAWYDESYIPSLLALPGVAGAWTFASQHTTTGDSRAGAEPVTPTADAPASFGSEYRILVLFLDQDPLGYARARSEHVAASGSDIPDRDSLETTLLRAVLRNIVPWQWDWFAEA